MARNLPSGANAGGGGAAGAVTSVAGRTGDVTLAVADVSGAAPTANATFTGTFVAPTGTITSAMIADGTVANGDLAGSIAASKITGTALTAADTGTVTSAIIADGTIVGGDLSSSIALPSGATATTQSAADNSTKLATTAYVDAKERVISFGKGGAIGATETNAADFPVCVPFAVTMKRMKVTLGTACSGAMTVQLRKATSPVTTPPSYSDVANFIVTFSSGNVLAVVDPADLTAAEGDFLNFSVGTGSGANLLVEVICV